MSSIPGWTAAQVQQAQLQMAAAAAVSTASSSSLQSGISFVSAASSVLSANTQNSTVGGQKANPPPSSCRQLLSSGLLHSLPSRDSNVTSSSSSFSSSSSSSSETSCTQAAAESSCAGSFYGQMLTQTLMQNARPQPQPQQFVAQTTRDAVAAVGSTCGVAGNGGSASFVRVLSSGYSSRPVSDSEALGVSSHPTLPPSPQRGLGAGLVAFQPTDISMGSPASSISSSSSSSSSCLTPDHFLGPSPQSVTSPGSVGPMESPDTTELQTGQEADSGYSDHLTDKSSSLDKLHAAEDPELTSSSGKRKRVRKSRAKQQDPKVKILVRKTRRVRANDRERDRMHGLNDAMDELRKHLPSDTDAGKLTKIDTLRTASNYIKVLKMMLGEIEKGEDPAHWSQDMLTAVNSLYVQPAASPDSTDISSPGPHDFGFEDDSPLQLQQQNCGGGGHGLSPGGVMMPAPFPSGAGYQSCAMADAFDPNCDTFDTRGGGAVPCGTALQAPGGMVGHGKGGSVPVLGDSTNYGGGGVSLPVNMNAVMPGPGGYAGLNAGFVSAASAVNSGGYHPAVHQQYGVVSGHCTSTQNMFLQSSQCY